MLLSVLIKDKFIIICFNSPVKKENIDTILSTITESNIISENPPYYNLRITTTETYSIRIIWPASEEELSRKNTIKYRSETANEYDKNPENVDKNTAWIENILNNKTEPVLYEDDSFFIINDYKWNRKIDDLYLLLITKRKNFYTVREATYDELINMKKAILEFVRSEYGLKEENLLLHIHYPPSYLRFHIHILNLKRTMMGSQSICRAVLLDEIIDNLKGDSDYYVRKKFYFAN